MTLGIVIGWYVQIILLAHISVFVYVQLLSHQGFRLSTLTLNTSRHTITRLHLNVNLTVGKPLVKTYTHVGTWTHTFFKANEKLTLNTKKIKKTAKAAIPACSFPSLSHFCSVCVREKVCVCSEKSLGDIKQG